MFYERIDARADGRPARHVTKSAELAPCVAGSARPGRAVQAASASATQKGHFYLEDAGLSCDTGSMSTSSRRTSSAQAAEDHEFAGWEPARPLSDDDRIKLERTNSVRDDVFNLVVAQGFTKILEELEGDLVPTCACGWRGYPEPWIVPGSRSRRGGQQRISHESSVKIEQATTQWFAATTAAAALRHDAEAWQGDEDVFLWLESRADHIESVGLYDGKKWP